MAGLLELFTQWVAETGQRPSDAVSQAADRARSSGDSERVERAGEIERINEVLFGNDGGGR
jgi:hypothetical protein